jgi:uracil-DNA glycosylase family 4
MKPCNQITCPFFENGLEVMDKHPLVAWNNLLVIGESPGREEVKRGVPFVGASGHILKTVLDHLHTSIEATHITNAIRCNFSGGTKPSDAAMKVARECCQGELEANIVEIKPRAILTLGGIALQSTTGLKGVEKFRGATTWQDFSIKYPLEVLAPETAQFPVDFDPKIVEQPPQPEAFAEEEWRTLVVSTIHPAAMLRAPAKHVWLDLFIADVEKAHLLANEKITLRQPEVEAFTVEAVQRVLESPSEPVAVDLETDGLDVRECGITTVGLARLIYDDETGEEKPLAVAIPCPGLRSYFHTEDWHSSWRALKAAFQDPERTWVFHNMAFDVPIIERMMQIKIAGRVNDTLLEHHAIYPKTPHDLQAVATQFFPVEPWKEYYDKRFINVSDEDIPALLYYNGADTANTILLHDKLRQEMRRENVLNVYETDRIITRYAMDWEKVGLGVDEAARLVLHKEFSESIACLKENIWSLVGSRDFNPNSPPQLQKVLVEQFNLVPKKVTKSGQLSTDATSLFEFRDHPFVELLQAYRTKTKLFSTYIDGLGQEVGRDGRIHTRWNKTSTPSGRFGTKPAVQNWPRSMRRMLVPAPGRCIISADFAALELRISVLLAGQEDLIEAFINGTDVHSMFAETYFGEIWNRASTDQRKLLRTNSKPVTFGDIYRAGPQTLFENVREDVPGITFQEVQTMQARKRAKYKNVNEYSAYVTEIANRTFELRTPWLGRRRRWPLGGVPDTEATNHPVQGGAADIVDAATIKWMQLLEEKGDYHTRVWPNMQIHDDLRAEVTIDYAQQALEDLMSSMRCSKKLASPITGKTYHMPFEVEGKVGFNHLDLHVPK